MITQILRLVRPIISLLLTVALLYLAYRGHDDAITALITAFSVLIGALWGERSALKVPGKEQ